MSVVKKNVIDSSGWLEYFSDGKNADFFARSIENTSHLIVPVISIYEVFKHVMHHHSEQAAFECIECMLQGSVVDITVETALNAAKLSVVHKLPLADSMIYAVAIAHHATLWTQDADFKGLSHVKYVSKQ